MKKITLPCLICLTFFSIKSVNAQVVLENHYPNDVSPTIGTFQNISFTEGGFSGLHYIPNTNGTEFWTLSDRGVNVDAANANKTATPSLQYPTCVPTYDKIYGFPTYAPKIHRIKIDAGKLIILNTITIKRPNGTGATGLLNPAGLGSTATEIVSTNVVQDCANFDANTASKDVWGIDSEGIDVDADGNFWICEEGGPTILKVNSNGVVQKRYTPYLNNLQPEDVTIDACFAFRRNNRGFEGITVTPNGKIYAVIQSPLYYKAVNGVAASGTLSSSQIHRILEIDPQTNTTRMFAYVNEGTQGTIKPKDIKIGDLKAINNTTFLVIEHAVGSTSTDDYKKVFTIDISNATPVQSGLAYAGGTKTLEELLTPAALLTNSVQPVSKTLAFDLYASGWPKTLDKAEGIAIIDSQTIAISNDNDYGQYSPNADGIATVTNTKSEVYVFKLNNNNILSNYVANNNMVVLSNNKIDTQDSAIDISPNPTSNDITINNVALEKIYLLYDIYGKLQKSGVIDSFSYNLSLKDFATGIYILQVADKTYKIIKN